MDCGRDTNKQAARIADHKALQLQEKTQRTARPNHLPNPNTPLYLLMLKEDLFISAMTYMGRLASPVTL